MMMSFALSRVGRDRKFGKGKQRERCRLRAAAAVTNEDTTEQGRRESQWRVPGAPTLAQMLAITCFHAAGRALVPQLHERY